MGFFKKDFGDTNEKKLQLFNFIGLALNVLSIAVMSFGLNADADAKCMIYPYEKMK